MKLEEAEAVIVPIKKIRTPRKKPTIKAKNKDIIPKRKVGRPRKKSITPSDSPLIIRGEGPEVSEGPGVISDEERTDFTTPFHPIVLSSLSDLKKRYTTLSHADLPHIEEALHTHSFTLKDITNELERVTEKYTKFKRLAETTFNQNNYVESDDSWNFRQYAKHYEKRTEQLSDALQEQKAVGTFFEDVVTTLREKGSSFHFSQSLMVVAQEKPSLKAKIKHFLKLLLKFYRPRN